MTTNTEIVESIENTIAPQSPLGMQVGTLAARLQASNYFAENYGRELLSLLEDIGNDARAGEVRESLERFRAACNPQENQ